MAGQSVEIRSEAGQRLGGYIAVPECGSGPGLLLLGEPHRAAADFYAEEGYVVLMPDDAETLGDVADAGTFLKSTSGMSGGIGALGFGRGAALAFGAAAQCLVDVAVCYDPVGLDVSAEPAVPATLHVAGTAQVAARPGINVFAYPGVAPGFHERGGPHYDKPAASMAHSRSIAALRRVLGPHYDLSALWEQHCYYEFGLRDVPRTMATMVAAPYVNHVPTMTGGVGYEALSRFYRDHFVNSNPKDTKLVPISRTIGADRVVDEMLFCFTHDVEIDWMLPGVKPTGRYVEIPLVAIINFRGDKLYHEHIYWDQASVLAQLGLLDPQTLPIAGIDTAKKLIDETLPSNMLIERRGG